MLQHRQLLLIAIIAFLTTTASASFVVDYTTDAGGTNSEPLNGMAAQATFTLNGATLTIILEDTSAGYPSAAAPVDKEMSALAFNFAEALEIASVISGDDVTGSAFVGSSVRIFLDPGTSASWYYTNSGGTGLLSAYDQVLSTNAALADGVEALTDSAPSVVLPLDDLVGPGTLMFRLTLSMPIGEEELQAMILADSAVEFGSGYQYVTPEPATTTPEASAIVLYVAGMLLCRRHVRH